MSPETFRQAIERNRREYHKQLAFLEKQEARLNELDILDEPMNIGELYDYSSNEGTAIVSRPVEQMGT